MNVTQEEAEQVLAVVKDTYKAWLDDDGIGPVIVHDYQSPGTTAIVWESGGPYEWGINFDPDHDTQDEEMSSLAERKVTLPKSNLPMPPGIYWDAYYSFDICLYKDES